MEIAFKHPNVTAILNAGYAGQESGRALVSILEGSVNPSGKLVYTILQNDKDYITVNSTLDNDPKSFFSENLLIDYRQADANNKPVRFEFGYGLSYTSFDYSDVQLRLVNKTTFALAGRDDTLMSITAKVRNIGKYDGAEVSQLYISFASGLGEPPKVLRGFTKSYLGTGKSSAISFEIRKKDISIWDDQLDSWALASGETTFLIGPSSRNLPLTIKTIL
jgi:beta-glucosidase